MTVGPRCPDDEQNQSENHSNEGALLSTRSVTIVALAMVIGLFAGLAAGISAGITAARAAGNGVGLMVGIAAGIAGALLAGLSAAGTLNALVSRKR